MSALPSSFANRIVGYTTKRASELTANPLNWRKHPMHQREAVNASLKELGWVAAVIENVNTGYLIDGHERVWQAMPNDDEVPVLQVALSEEEERLALAILDPLTSLAETDGEILESLLAQIESPEGPLTDLLAVMLADTGLHGETPSLDELADKYGAPEERAFWPVIRVQVSPETMERYQSLLALVPGGDEAAKVEIILSAVDATLLDA